jgi:hypothetical protein
LPSLICLSCLYLWVMHFQLSSSGHYNQVLKGTLFQSISWCINVSQGIIEESFNNLHARSLLYFYKYHSLKKGPSRAHFIHPWAPLSYSQGPPSRLFCQSYNHAGCVSSHNEVSLRNCIYPLVYENHQACN